MASHPSAARDKNPTKCNVYNVTCLSGPYMHPTVACKFMLAFSEPMLKIARISSMFIFMETKRVMSLDSVMQEFASSCLR